MLKIEEPVIRSLVREGYKVYDANGILMRTCEDEMVNEAAWNETIRSFADGTLYALKRDGENYIFEIDAPDEEGKCIFSGKPSHRRVLFARSY